MASWERGEDHEQGRRAISPDACGFDHWHTHLDHPP